jgi:hypothetical protein
LKNNWNSYKFCKGPNNNVELLPGADNPFFERCSAEVYYSNLVQDIQIVNSQGQKFSINTIFILNSSTKLSPQNIYDICVFSNNINLQVGYCDCRYCLKLFDLAKAYSVNDISTCINLFGKECSCFEQSNVDVNGNGFVYQTYSICTECKYDSQCSSNLKLAYCNRSIYTNIISQPVVISPDNLNNINYSLDFGRVTDGRIFGDYCNCNYFDRINYPYISLNGNRFTYDFYYFPLFFQNQFFKDCVMCLYDTTQTINDCYNNSYCLQYKTSNLDYYTYPGGGNNCRSCVYSGELLQTLYYTDRDSYEAIVNCINKSKNNFFTNCNNLIESLSYDPSKIFIGLISNFRVECPGRDYLTYGSVCNPWYGFNNYSKFTLAYKKTANNTQWEDNFQCMNESCEPVSKINCTGSCVCYDTCSLGNVNFPIFNQNITVPCSGNGICTINGCICDWGYLLPDCLYHCSNMPGGCCINDDDCANQIILNKCINISSEIGNCG